jgi:hypothetical protein
MGCLTSIRLDFHIWDGPALSIGTDLEPPSPTLRSERSIFRQPLAKAIMTSVALLEAEAIVIDVSTLWEKAGSFESGSTLRSAG